MGDFGPLTLLTGTIANQTRINGYIGTFQINNKGKDRLLERRPTFSYKNKKEFSVRWR